jgi:hypothetical protein
MAKSASDVSDGPIKKARVVVRTDTTDPEKISGVMVSGIVTSQAEDADSFNAPDKRWPGTKHSPGAIRCIHECSFHVVNKSGKRKIRQQTHFTRGQVLNVGAPFYAQAAKSACFEKCVDDVSLTTVRQPAVAAPAEAAKVNG